MSKKKARAFFVYPHWDEIAGATQDLTRPSKSGRIVGAAKAMADIKGGQPVARSTLCKALLAVQRTSGRMFDLEAYIVDQRSERRR